MHCTLFLDAAGSTLWSEPSWDENTARKWCNESTIGNFFHWNSSAMHVSLWENQFNSTENSVPLCKNSASCSLMLPINVENSACNAKNSTFTHQTKQASCNEDAVCVCCCCVCVCCCCCCACVLVCVCVCLRVAVSECVSLCCCVIVLIPCWVDCA